MKDTIEKYAQSLNAGNIEFSIYKGNLDELINLTFSTLKIPASSPLKALYELLPIEKYYYVDALGNPLLFYGIDLLVKFQTGYRWTDKQEAIDIWDENWVAIGDGGSAEPIIYNIATNSIMHAMYGQGNWVAKEIAPDIKTFIETMTVWINMFVIKFNSNVYDEDFNVNADFESDISKSIRDCLDEQTAQNWMYAIFE